MKTLPLHQWTRITLVILGIALAVAIFVPIWSIYLNAPQYPEGLAMFIHSNKVSGEYKIINGLNHYIGMKEIHADEFWEFKILPYALAFFAALCLLAAFMNSRKILYFVTGLFLLFGVGFVIDFWRWLYDYGHNLNPNAAIIVPGMSYQPPLFGYKQLLNFEVWSYPNIGGGIMIGAGVILIILAFVEFRAAKKAV
ncbi:hypothetical protein EIB71_07115 [Kaistella daneshvariae]|jgi:hypothetical protein|uniref:Copper chaperone NosL n=1 Tax=Kaistella daneshvariae TaxID=2487074 RepID=A0A3N0WTC5_9FLAO|nr:hypothetical protein [Kaistella daneshvariae]AZI67452.1 hypothetical protein EIB71_07115 [Kaistella daneshvariae]ROI08367.1 hypothetical protein EGI11_12130 [Kaistella daneshvariae]